MFKKTIVSDQYGNRLLVRRFLNTDFTGLDFYSLYLIENDEYITCFKRVCAKVQYI
jgi:hypothetical protein